MNIMLRRLNNSHLIIKRCFSNNPLGRWTIDKDKLETDTTVDWANHDHCGSQSCTLAVENTNEKDLKISIKEDKLISNDSKLSPKSLSSAVITKEEYPDDDETLKYFLVSGFHLNIVKDEK